ncbi:hypothetical protein ON010_g18030 [Phytophthora cinnamomi]|nr:hypothetical protein ON010_g18030 [Phytophthora cinnamomi]
MHRRHCSAALCSAANSKQSAHAAVVAVQRLSRPPRRKLLGWRRQSTPANLASSQKLAAFTLHTLRYGSVAALTTQPIPAACSPAVKSGGGGPTVEPRSYKSPAVTAATLVKLKTQKAPRALKAQKRLPAMWRTRLGGAAVSAIGGCLAHRVRKRNQRTESSPPCKPAVSLDQNVSSCRRFAIVGLISSFNLANTTSEINLPPTRGREGARGRVPPAHGGVRAAVRPAAAVAARAAAAAAEPKSAATKTSANQAKPKVEKTLEVKAEEEETSAPLPLASTTQVAASTWSREDNQLIHDNSVYQSFGGRYGGSQPYASSHSAGDYNSRGYGDRGRGEGQYGCGYAGRGGGRYGGDFAGRGGGRYGGIHPGRGGGRFGGNDWAGRGPERSANSAAGAKANTHSHYCHVTGHWYRECPARIADAQERQALRARQPSGPNVSATPNQNTSQQQQPQASPGNAARQ